MHGQHSSSNGSRPDTPTDASIASPVPGPPTSQFFQTTSDPFTHPTSIRQDRPLSTDGYDSMSELTTTKSSHSMHQDSHLDAYNAYNGSMIVPSIPHSTPVDDRSYNYVGVYPTRSSAPDSSHTLNPFTNPMQSSISPAQQNGGVYTLLTGPSPSSSNPAFRSPTDYSNISALPSYGYPTTSYGGPSGTRSENMLSPPTFGTVDQQLPTSRSNSIFDFTAFDSMGTGYAMPVFGSGTPLARSPPPAMDENFLNMLFSSNGIDVNDATSSEPEPEAMQMTPGVNGFLPKMERGGTSNDAYLYSPSSAFDTNAPQSALSVETQQRLLDLVHSFSEIKDNPGRRSKADILAGNAQYAPHVMSLQMLRTYLASFWLHIHQQMPILHRPTFNPDTCPAPLLLSMMCLGATCLERAHTLEMTSASAEFAFFIAYHIRWEVFKDAEFRPTAKLWTFQSMLLLELFEKMFSTRELHERGHVHHATTLTVMRRGSSLVGRCAIETPGRSQDPTRTPPGPEGTINASGQNTGDAFWNRWITAEATRRAAFAAFIIDSTHATMFGHSAITSPHELKLPLPCDEALWAATSSAEVQRGEAGSTSNGSKVITFLEGLRRVLNGQKVRTNTFGRVILMAGLLNVSWHMNQRDLQVSSLRAPGTLGSQIKWRSPLTRAFDFWRRDFDESMAKNEHWSSAGSSMPNSDAGPLDHREIVFESRTCLHSLAHMAMHVDMIDCQLFAGAERAIGRMVTDGDRAAVQQRMREQWAPSARARDAVFYALRFLCEVLIPEEELGWKQQQQQQPPPRPKAPTFRYSARNDYLLNRPWVLYFATLIVWCYGYALDGPIVPSNYTLTSRELQVHDMQRYLIRMGGVASPDELERLRNRNSCLGLLLLLRETFEEPRWELMHEAAETLSSCIDLLLPRRSSVGGS